MALGLVANSNKILFDGLECQWVERLCELNLQGHTIMGCCDSAAPMKSSQTETGLLHLCVLDFLSLEKLFQLLRVLGEFLGDAADFVIQVPKSRHCLPDSCVPEDPPSSGYLLSCVMSSDPFCVLMRPLRTLSWGRLSDCSLKPVPTSQLNLGSVLT